MIASIILVCLLHHFSTLFTLLHISNTFIFDKILFVFVSILGKSRVLLCDLKWNPQIKFYSEFPSYNSKFYDIIYLFISFDLLSFCWLTHIAKAWRDTWSLHGLWGAVFSINVCHVKAMLELVSYLCCVRSSHFIGASLNVALFSHYFL